MYLREQIERKIEPGVDLQKISFKKTKYRSFSIDKEKIDPKKNSQKNIDKEINKQIEK